MDFPPEPLCVAGDDLDEAARLDVVFEREARAPLAAGPIPLSPEYLRLLLEVEAAPANQDGEDKSWVEAALASYRRHYRLARDERA